MPQQHGARAHADLHPEPLARFRCPCQHGRGGVGAREDGDRVPPTARAPNGRRLGVQPPRCV
eukprot:11173932-Lingulodinium_polyedra.AAC.1